MLLFSCVDEILTVARFAYQHSRMKYLPTHGHISSLNILCLVQLSQQDVLFQF